MNSAHKSHILIIDDPRIGGLPYIIEPDTADNWTNQEAFTEIWATIVAVIRLGYRGVIAESHKLGVNRYFLRLHADRETPEGRVMRHLYGLARKGVYFPTHEVTSYLKDLYSERGLPAPVPEKDKGSA